MPTACLKCAQKVQEQLRKLYAEQTEASKNVFRRACAWFGRIAIQQGLKVVAQVIHLARAEALADVGGAVRQRCDQHGDRDAPQGPRALVEPELHATQHKQPKRQQNSSGITCEVQTPHVRMGTKACFDQRAASRFFEDQAGELRRPKAHAFTAQREFEFVHALDCISGRATVEKDAEVDRVQLCCALLDLFDEDERRSGAFEVKPRSWFGTRGVRPAGVGLKRCGNRRHVTILDRNRSAPCFVWECAPRKPNEL
jgi:hypothetical protein